jgi:segregation and condensation protein B
VVVSQLAQLEGLVYMSGKTGISNSKLQQLLDITDVELKLLVTQLKKNLASSDSPFVIIEFADKLQLATKPELNDLLSKYLEKDNRYTLTQTALETLTVVAYKQPVTRVEIDDIRGVNSSKVMQRLLDCNMIQVNGHKKVPGNPKLYITTDTFLKTFGMKKLSDLPEIDKDIILKEK